MPSPLPFYFGHDVFAAGEPAVVESPVSTEDPEQRDENTDTSQEYTKETKIWPFFIFWPFTLAQLGWAAGLVYVHYMRSVAALVPLMLYAIAWVHLVTPFFFIASLISSDCVKLLNLTAILDSMVLVVDIIFLALAIVFKSSFGSHMHFVWTVTAQAFFVFGGLVSVFGSSYLIAKEEARQAKKSDDTEVSDPDAADRKAWKGVLQGGGRVRVFLWLIFGLLVIVRALFSMVPAWHLVPSLPYLWAVPFIVGAVYGRQQISAIAAAVMISFSALSMIGVLIIPGVTEGGYLTSAYRWVDILDWVAIAVGIAMAVLDGILGFAYASSLAFLPGVRGRKMDKTD
jgi:hypothetical protein